MSLNDLSLDGFIITDSNQEFTLDYENLDVYLHEKAEESNINYTYLINSLLEDEQYSPYIIYLLIHKFNLNNQTKEETWIELMIEGYYQINNIFDVDSLNLSQDNYSRVMWLAASRGHEHIVELMLEYGADVHFFDRTYNTALEKAANGGYINIIRLLLANGADVNNHTNLPDSVNLNTALIKAANKGHSNIVELLLSIPEINVNLINKKGDKALTRAAYKGYYNIVNLILNTDLDVNHANNKGNTALILAAVKGHNEIVQLLFIQYS